ncbi:MAG: hypothetical protein R3F07_03920 [Opitutaceae bacterium]
MKEGNPVIGPPFQHIPDHSIPTNPSLCPRGNTEDFSAILRGQTPEKHFGESDHLPGCLGHTVEGSGKFVQRHNLAVIRDTAVVDLQAVLGAMEVHASVSLSLAAASRSSKICRTRDENDLLPWSLAIASK